MAGILKPNNAKSEVGYKIWKELSTQPASNLFNGSYTTPATPYFYWNTAGQFLDIEFYADVRIYDAGSSVAGAYNNPMKVFHNTDGIKGAYIKDISPNKHSAVPDWTIVAELPKGRYLMEYTGLRISNEWYLESTVTNKSFILSTDGYKKLDKGSPEITGLNNIIPVMTSKTTPKGVTSASSIYSAGNDSWYAFDKNTATYWFAYLSPPTGGHWIQYKYENPKRVSKISLIGGRISAGIYGVKEFKVLASNDGVVFSELFSTTSHPNSDARVEYEFENKNEYLYYRIQGDSYSLGSMLINEIEMFEASIPATPSSWKTVSPTLPTLTQFQSEGMDDLSVFDRKVQTVLESPQTMTSSVLGEGKVFKSTVDLKKYFDLRKLEVK